jgi:DNA-binding CsgD family transcriptional regulator
MNTRIKIADLLYTHASRNNPILSKIPNILKTCECSKNMTIGIYLIEDNHFVYINKSLKRIIGSNYIKLLFEGWDYWYSIVDKTEVSVIKLKVKNYFTTPYVQRPLNLRYHITDFYGNRLCLKHEISLYRLERKTVALNYFFDVSDKERIEQFFGIKNENQDPKLDQAHNLIISAREREVLQLIANGFSSKQIAEMLFISNHTAISHRKNLIEKFQVKNTAHLIKKASGFIGI